MLVQSRFRLYQYFLSFILILSHQIAIEKFHRAAVSRARVGDLSASRRTPRGCFLNQHRCTRGRRVDPEAGPALPWRAVVGHTRTRTTTAARAQAGATPRARTRRPSQSWRPSARRRCGGGSQDLCAVRCSRTTWASCHPSASSHRMHTDAAAARQVLEPEIRQRPTRHTS